METDNAFPDKLLAKLGAKPIKMAMNNSFMRAFAILRPADAV
jgi:hypothetical protein